MAANESLVLDGLELNPLAGDYNVEGLRMVPPGKRQEWASGADADGASLVRDPLHENREIEVRLRIGQQSTMDTALAKVAAIIDKVEKADRTEGGIPLVWTPADSTKSFTFYVLSGSY